MEKKKHNHNERGRMRYTKEMERTFLFYATVGMFILWLCLNLLGQ